MSETAPRVRVLNTTLKLYLGCNTLYHVPAVGSFARLSTAGPPFCKQPRGRQNRESRLVGLLTKLSGDTELIGESGLITWSFTWMYLV